MSGLSRIIWTCVAAVMVAKTIRDVRFYVDKKVVQVNAVAEIDKLRDNMVAEISLGLDTNRTHTITYLNKKEFLLIPFSDAGYKLMYVVEGPLTDKYMASLQPPLKGRVVEKDFAETYDVFDESLELSRIFSRDGIELPGNAMLIYDAPKVPPNLWIFCLCAVSVVFIIYQSYALTNFVLRRKPNSKEKLGGKAIPA